jgi:cytochrome P450
VFSKDKAVSAKASYKTVFRSILDSNLPAQEKSRKRLLDEALVLVGAGSLTSAHFLRLTTFYLCENPEMMRKLKAELEQAMPDPNVVPSLPELEKLPYMHTIVQETFRLTYGVAHRVQRLAPDESLHFHGWVIPPNTPCSMSGVQVHINPELFPEPSEFVPERWADPNEDRRLSKYLLNFGRGTRSCIGMELANAEVHYALAVVMRRFDFELFETDITDVEMKHDYFNPLPKLDSKGIRVIVK